MDQDKQFAQNFEPVFVARQPIFNRRLQVWGHELLFRHSGEAKNATFENSDSATAKVILDGFSIAQQGLPVGTKKAVNFSKQLILDEAPYVMPKGEIVELLEDIVLDSDFIEKCTELKKDFLIAIDDYSGQDGWEELLKLADIIKVDLLNLSLDGLAEITEWLKMFPGKLLAEKIENREMFIYTKNLGYQYFQGYFFSKPQVIEGRKLSSNEASRLKILEELSSDDIDPHRLKGVIESDVSITFRLFTFINSPGFGLLNQVRSVEHALKLLGEKQIRQWLRVLILSDFGTTSQNKEHVQTAAVRAFFLKHLAEFFPPPLETDTLFTIGLFSKLDALLNQPLIQILEKMSVADEIKDVLLGLDAEAASSWLRMAEFIECGQWNEVEAVARQNGFAMQKIADAYARALIQSRQLLSDLH
jgi:EAL and modified HD-GYP domain-containing signal transduction protein